MKAPANSAHAAIKHKDVGDVLPPREKKTRQVEFNRGKAKISVAIRFSADEGEIPDELLRRLNDVLKEINRYAEVKMLGLDA